MLSKKIRKSIVQAGVMAIVALSGTVAHQMVVPSQIVHAATMGEVTITVSSLWSYSRADWNARADVYRSGQKFTVAEKLTVEDGTMYRLTNGRYISANPKYVSYKGIMPNTGTTSKILQTTAALNMRSGDSVSHGILLTIPSGGKVEYVSTSPTGWHQVKYNGKTGYVSPKYVKDAGTQTNTPAPTPTPTPTPPQTTSQMYQTTGALNMRSGDSVSHGVILVLPGGAKVEYVSTAPSGWYQVKYNGKTGYVSAKYVKAVAGTPTTPTPAPTPTPTPAPAPPSNQISGATIKVNLNLRAGEGTGHKILATMPQGAKVSVVKRGTSWSQIKYNDITGYASNSYIDFTTIPGTGAPAPTPVPTPTPPSSGNSESYVGNTSLNHTLENIAGSVMIPLHMVKDYEVKTKIALNMRSGAGLEHSVITTIPKHVSMKREELLDNGWAKVTYEGKTGYINTGDAYVSTIPVVWKETSSWAKLKRDTPNKPLGVSAIENALLQLTKPYQWGAEGPVDYDRDGDVREGFDCSGLTQWAFNEAGKLIQRTTATGYNKGTQISRENIQIGDLIYFKTTNSSAPVTHVAMYMGDNMMLHASSGMKMTAVSEVYWQYMVTIVRHN